MQKRLNDRGGFALPTVLIASVVMLTILAVSVSSVTAVRTTLKTQYYEQLAKAAGEAGVAYAKACLAQNGNKPLWTDNKPLTPSSDCAGNNAFATEPFRALIVAGGGSGGGSTGGGGGAGGVITADDFSLTPGSYPVVVGAGGAAPGNQAIGRDGNDSSFNDWIANGGGGGGYSAGSSSGAAGRPGGSGGGGQRYYGTYGPGVGTIGQGNDGGSLTGAGAGSTTGGGGAGGPGLSTATTNGGGSGGPGIMSTITGAAVYYGGGGGGGSSGGTCGGSSAGGIGGGGRSGELGTAGQPNTGGGGGGGWCYASGNGGAGGSGVVIIAYPDNGSVTASGGTQVYSSAGYKVHIFKGSGTFSVSSVTNSSCPTDPRCSVMTEANLRSSFRVTKPTLDANGRALTVPNSGYVELLRSTTGEVWRTYRQPAVQSAVVPDLCSGAAASTLGWQNAVVTSTQQTLANASSAQTISMLDTTLAAGKVYFRKDFTVVEAGTYTLSAITDSSSTIAAAYIDSQLVTTAQGSSTGNTVSLSVGCHTITVQMTNRTLQPKAARITAALQKAGATPILATDSSWRVSSGSSVHFSQPDFYADPSIWTKVSAYPTPTAQAASSAWQSTQNDIFTGFITPSTGDCAPACPVTSSGYVRDSKDFYVSSPTEVQVSTLCDDDCSVFLDGEMVIANSPWSAINQQTLTLTPGPHHLAARVYNGAGTGYNPAGVAISVVEKATGVVLTRTDRSWLGSTVWTSGLNASTEDIRSYEDSFRPSPDEVPRPTTIDFLVVAGGGGGGGNCATCGGAGGGGGGGVIYQENVVATTGTRTVTVGAGGAAGVGGASRTNGGNGGNSVFGTFTAIGGGGGGAQLGTAGLNGGSGGGGSGGGSPAAGAGGSGTSGQGYGGGAGVGDPYSGGGGGGAQGPGVAGAGTIAGNGGAGFTTYITGSLMVTGAGGGAAAYGANYAGASDVGAGNGVNQNINSGVGYPGTANTGGGGGGGNGLNRGGNGGVGGSGVVIIRVKTGTVTVSTTGSPTVTNVTIDGIGYTVYRFNASGSFTISAIN